MKILLSKPIVKAAVDIVLIAGLFVSMITAKSTYSASWRSLHCMASMAWYAMMLVHIWIHRRLIKALVKPKVLKRNKITFLTLVMFVLMTFSILLFVFGVNHPSTHIHHTIAHLFWMVMIIHALKILGTRTSRPHLLKERTGRPRTQYFFWFSKRKR